MNPNIAAGRFWRPAFFAGLNSCANLANVLNNVNNGLKMLLGYVV